MKSFSVVCVVVLGMIAAVAAIREEHGGLREDYYRRLCPRAEAIIAHMLRDFTRQDKNLSASLVRLHFHDCFVRVSFFSFHPHRLHKYTMAIKNRAVISSHS